MAGRRMVILTDGYAKTLAAKTAHSVIRYCSEEVVALLDRSAEAPDAERLIGFGGAIPVVRRLSDAPGARTLLIGISPPGGKLPEAWRAIILEAIERGMTVVSGLHDFLSHDARFAEAARKSGARLIDVRSNQENEVASYVPLRPECLRILTVANDCSCGKMTASLEVARRLQALGKDAKFVATGQTGIMIEGDGCPIDRVIADFVSGAAEKLVLENQHHEILLIEGQGSLCQPRYSGVTLGLLHGTRPDGLILCYEMGRNHVFGMPEVPLPPLEEVVRMNLQMAGLFHPARMIGIAVNGGSYSSEAVDRECREVAERFDVPAVDLFRQGPQPICEAVLALQKSAASPR
jgi:uncharacterized NAD-dependent epimerase/dehydratase family protein